LASFSDEASSTTLSATLQTEGSKNGPKSLFLKKGRNRAFFGRKEKFAISTIFRKTVKIALFWPEGMKGSEGFSWFVLRKEREKI